ncbi:TlpA family protein disulfide reductase [Confluentibacter sediminis]|uniref:TlpA family protein disulfide reductase n=1 Tax=Confluentibacter sediminis TaxID=2219045 RepID=UPI000DAB4911|nr:TlpA disulfide reductase family protein [Confluentibacter sediminis]
MNKLLICLLIMITCSSWGQQEAIKKYNYQDFNLIVKVEDQEVYFNKMLQEEPEDESNTKLYNVFRVALATDWLAKGNIEKYRYYMQTDPEVSGVSLINLTYVLQDLVEDENYLNIVKEISKRLIDDIEKKSNDDDVIGIFQLQVLLEVNAMANAELGNVDIALKNIQKSSEIKDGAREIKYFKDSKANYYNRYAIVLSAAGEDKKALDTLVEAVRNADSNPKLVKTLRKVYKKVHGNDKGADKLITDLQEEAYEKEYKEVEKHYIAESTIPFEGTIPDPSGSGESFAVFNATKHAYEISLPDLNGNTINFNDYKGKILVIDFWTTACTPCVASFAGFEQVVAEYKNEPFQLFVIDIFEEQETVKSFIAKKGISLDVLHDEDNETYEVAATPNKIVFDTKGNIRFYSIAYAGSTDREYYKLKAMVEITKAKNKS